jgi:Na+/H+-dicarboxylate symporter
MARTAINVFADAVCTVIVARLEGEKDVLTDVTHTARSTTATPT